MNVSRLFPVLLGMLLAAMILLVYLPVILHGGFIWDDDFHVTSNPVLTEPGGLRRIWTEPRSIPQYYPLTHTTFWLEQRLWGFLPRGYHLDNVLLHALAAVLLWRFLLAIGAPGAWMAAALFAVHPVAVESVAWVSERKNVLSLVLALLAALAWQRFSPPDGRPVSRAGRGWWYAVSLLLFLAALLAKTVVATLPAALLAVIWWKRGRIALREAAALAPFLAVGASLGLVTVYLERTQVGAVGADWDLTAVQRLIIAGRAVVFYLGKLIWPARLTFIYPRWEPGAGDWGLWLFPAGVIAGLAILFLARRRIGRGPFAAAVTFVAVLCPALGFFDVFPFRYSFVADHFQYHAMTAPLALAGAALAGVRERLPALPRLAATAVAAVMLLLLGSAGWQQAGIYRDQETLWKATLQNNPRSWMAAGNLGIFLASQGRYREATVFHRMSLALVPENGLAHNNLGAALWGDGRDVEAIAEFREALRLDPGLDLARENLNRALQETRR